MFSPSAARLSLESQVAACPATIAFPSPFSLFFPCPLPVLWSIAATMCDHLMGHWPWRLGPPGLLVYFSAVIQQLLFRLRQRPFPGPGRGQNAHRLQDRG